jgi:DNA invertase Pin-like site-specific DNA recombinase
MLKFRLLNPKTQLLPLREYCERCDYEYVEYVDKARARDFLNRTAWQQLLKDIRQRKINLVLVYKLDRAFRTVRDCANVLDEWFERGVKFKSLTQDAIDTTTSMGKFVLYILAAAAELESSLISDRVTAGMARAKTEGVILGRRMLSISVTNIIDTLTRFRNVSAAAEKLKCSRAYIYHGLAKVGTTPKNIISNGSSKNK